MEVKIVTSVDYNDILIQAMPFFLDPRLINIEVEILMYKRENRNIR